MRKKILFVDACISNNQPSRTKLLCNALLEGYTEHLKDAEIETFEVTALSVSAVNAEKLEMRNKLIAANAFEHPMFELARQFTQADIIVIGAPYWDLSFPAVLKSYIENIMVTNLAFKYTETGSKGLCRAKLLVYITTSGGYIQDCNFGYDYMVGISDMVGIEKTKFISAEGLDIDTNDSKRIVDEAVINIRTTMNEYLI